jgi:heat shock protein HtpX
MWEQIRSNRRRSFMLATFMAAILVALGYFLAEYFAPGYGIAGIVIACGIWVVMALTTYFGGNQMFLAMAKAKRIEKQDLPRLYNIVEEMTIASGLGKMPAVYIIDDPAPNAFATGRNPENAAVAVTSGLVRMCSRDELQGVIAHEIGHIRNRDVLLMLFAGVMVGAIAILAEVGLRSHWFMGGRSRRSSGDGGGQAIIVLIAVALMILAPLIAQFVYFAISRKREYLADASAARYTRYPEGLASALEKIAASPTKLGSVSKVTAPMYIINPLQREGSQAANLTSTHPPITERVKILRAMGGASFAAYDEAFRQTKRRRAGVIPSSALQDKDEVEVRKPTVAERLDGLMGPLIVATAGAAAKEGAQEAKRRAREVDDFLYRKEKYRELDCTCGTTLKIPPGFLDTRVTCPHCDRQHDLGDFHAMPEPDQNLPDSDQNMPESDQNMPESD